MSAKILSKEAFNKGISKGVSIVDFWAPWCGACRMTMPVFEQIAEKRSDANFFKYNIDDDQELPTQFGISAIPTFIVFKDGKEVDRVVGHVTVKSISDLIDTYL